MDPQFSIELGVYPDGFLYGPQRGFLSLGTRGGEGGCIYEVLTSIPALCPQDTSSKPPSSVMTNQNVARHCPMSGGRGDEGAK